VTFAVVEAEGVEGFLDQLLQELARRSLSTFAVERENGADIDNHAASPPPVGEIFPPVEARWLGPPRGRSFTPIRWRRRRTLKAL